MVSISSIRKSIAKAVMPATQRATNGYRYPKFSNSPRNLVHNELGRSGLRRFFPGWIRDENLPELQGRRKYLVFNEMGDQNAYCAACLNAFAMFLRRAEWKVDPVIDDNKTNGSAKFLEELMGDMEHAWQTFIATASRVVPQQGFAPFELIYKIRDGEKEDHRYSSKFEDGLIGWQNLSLRAPETILHWVWYEDDPNRLQGLIQLTPPDYPPNLFIPVEKMLLLRAEPGTENPEGRSVLRSSYKSFFTIKYAEDIRNVIMERGGAGIPTAYVPPTIADPWVRDPLTGEVELNEDTGLPEVDPVAQLTLQSIIDTLTNMRQGEEPYIIIPTQYDEKGNKLFDITYLTNEGGSLISQINDTIKEEGMKILMSTMTEFLALGTNATGGGSFALSKDKTDNFTLAITSYLDAFEESINNQAVRRIFKLNPQFEDVEVLPRIVHTPIVPIDMRDVGMILGMFKGVGWDISDDQKIKNAILDELGLPKSTSNKTVPLTAQPVVPGQAGAGMGTPKPPTPNATKEE
jgi:hypothetical protein